VRKLIAAASVLVTLAVAGCGDADSTSSASAKPKKSWTVEQVEKAYDERLQAAILMDKDNIYDDAGITDVDTTCLLSDGKEGSDGTLTCHIEYDDEDETTLSAKIEIDPTGSWIASKI
jgi:hypothetical protein